MDKRSSGGVVEEWRQQALSGHALCRVSIGAGCRGYSPFNTLKFFVALRF